MAIPILPQTVTSSRRLFRLLRPSCFTASVSLTNRYTRYGRSISNCRGASPLRYFSMPSPLAKMSGGEGSASDPSALLVSFPSHCRHRPWTPVSGRNGWCSHRNYFGTNTTQEDSNVNQFPFFKNSSKLPPSSSSILKQDDHELSVEELKLKNALQGYTSSINGINNTESDDESEFLLENLLKAYMDMEYWEEALQIEVYKCQMYCQEGTDEHADSIHAQGKLYLRREDFISSKVLYEEALEYFKRAENKVQQGHVLISLAGWYFFRNQLDDALKCLDRSETLLSSNPVLLYKCLDNQGLVYRLWGEFRVALDKYQQALQVVLVDDKETRSALKMHIADMHLALEEPNEAMNVYQDLLIELAPTSTTNSEKHGLGMRGVLLHNIATICVDQGEHELALEHFSEALVAKKTAGGEHNPEVAKTLNSLGALHAGSFGEKQVALTYFKQALMIARIHAEDRENPQNDPDVMNVLQNISVIEQDLAAEQQQ